MRPLPGDTPGHVTARVEADGVLIHRERDVQQRVERLGEVGVGDLVAGLPALRLGNDDAAVAQAGEMVLQTKRKPKHTPV